MSKNANRRRVHKWFDHMWKFGGTNVTTGMERRERVKQMKKGKKK